MDLADKRINTLLIFFLAIIFCLGILFTNSLSAQTPGGETQAEDFYSKDKEVLAKGEQLFENNCSACHNFLQKGIGPNLGQVTARTTPAWLTRFIRNAPEVIKSGDAHAKALFEEYRQYMPPFTGLSDPDLKAILSWIHSNQTRPPAASAENFGDALADPVPARIARSGMRLVLEEVTTAPATAQKAPLARINKMVVLPGKKERVFLSDLRGKLYEMVGNDLREYLDMNTIQPGFINIPGHGTGLGSYAFHPEFYKNGLFYTTHTEKAQSAPADFSYADSIRVTLQWVLTEWKVKKPAAAAFAGTPREMLRINMVSGIHGVQEITFNPLARRGSPDYGLLYIGIGDGGASENGYYFLCNDNTNPWSSVLRIDPTGRNSKNNRYGIPAINPFAHDSDPNVLGEVFCRGFRNPNRISWTPDGKMLITDIGHNNAEEINLGEAGADYGWPYREGTFVINFRGRMHLVYALPDKDREFTYPVAQYDHDEGNAISGGFVYNGAKIPALRGKYVFGDVVNGRVFAVESNELVTGRQAPVQELEIEVGGKRATFQELTGNKKTDLRFGTGSGNELYLYTKSDGKIYRVVGFSPEKAN